MPHVRRFSSHCPACGRYNAPDIMLCQPCWTLLPAQTRELLQIPDRYQADRYAQLIRALFSGLPPWEVRVPSYRNLFGSMARFAENLDRIIQEEENKQLPGQLSLF